jgi:hypothetical protein
VHLGNGVLTAVNAGHVLPLLARSDQVQLLPLPADPPLGVLPGSRYRSTEVQLRPGDRLLLVTDGMLERNAASLDLVSHILTTPRNHPREAVRYLADAVVAVSGPVLPDDATLLILDWHGGHQNPRNSHAGADARSTTPPTAELASVPTSTPYDVITSWSTSLRHCPRRASVAAVRVGDLDMGQVPEGIDDSEGQSIRWSASPLPRRAGRRVLIRAHRRL